jgi:hypothetical protein
MSGTRHASNSAVVKQREIEMKSHGIRVWSITTGLIVLLLIVQCIMAENKVWFVKDDKNQVLLRLANTDPIAGMQFSINARAVSLKSFEQTGSSELRVYQYLRDDATLNVVILASVHCALPAGEGMIGRVVFEMNSGSEADTCELFLTRLEFCGQNALALEVTASSLVWRNDDGAGGSRSDCRLEQNYPNPFNPSTTIAYEIERSSHVVLSVYDITGRQVEILVDRYQPAGTYRVQWIADGVTGQRLASGVYIARLRSDGGVSAKTMNYTK